VSSNIVRTIVVVAAFLVLLISLGVVYWGPEFREWPACAFGNAECSLTLATYLLVCITTVALGAAAAAAVWAKKTYDMEQTRILSQRECTASDHNDALIEYHIAEWKILRGAPPNVDKWSYVTLESELESLGRSPVLAAGMFLRCSVSREIEISESSESGDFSRALERPMSDVHLRSDGSVHLRVFVKYPLVNAGIVVHLSRPNDDGIEYNPMPGGMQAKYRVLLPLTPQQVKDQDSVTDLPESDEDV